MLQQPLKHAVLDALYHKAEGEVKVAEANIECAIRNPQSIPDHMDMVSDVYPLFEELERAESVRDLILQYYENSVEHDPEPAACCDAGSFSDLVETEEAEGEDPEKEGGFV